MSHSQSLLPHVLSHAIQIRFHHPTFVTFRDSGHLQIIESAKISTSRSSFLSAQNAPLFRPLSPPASRRFPRHTLALFAHPQVGGLPCKFPPTCSQQDVNRCRVSWRWVDSFSRSASEINHAHICRHRYRFQLLQVEDRHASHAHRLKTLAEDREVTRLGGSVFDTGLISPEAMAATLRALKRFQRAVQSHGVDRIRVVATSAMRDARNAAAFQAWVKAETGWNMEIISGLEEGRLIHLGVTGAEPGAGGRVLLLDLGGGSCEITLSEHKRIKETISLPLGAVRLTEQFLAADPRRADGLARMRQLIARELRRAHRKIQPGRAPLVIATSGTAAALSDACAAGIKERQRPAAKQPANRVRRSRVRSRPPLQCLAGMVPARAVRKLAGKLAKMSLPEREAIPGIGPRRAEIIVAGARGLRRDA